MNDITAESQNDDSHQSIRKKRKIDHNFMVDGSIVKVVLKNFM